MDSFEQARTDKPTVELTIRGRRFHFTRRGNVMKLATFLDAPASTQLDCPECGERIQVGSHRPELDAAEAAVAMIEAMVEGEELDEWKAILESDEEPLTPLELRLIVFRVLGLIADRPTERPSDSSSTASETGTSSTAGSPLPAGVA